MATVSALGGGQFPNAANLSNAQTGNGVSTNVVDRGNLTKPVLLKITTAVGATPTCTYALEGSPDNTNWFSIPYADSATPTTVAVATFVITTAGTVWKVLLVDFPWRYFRITYSANTNVTNTSDAWVF